MERNLLRQMWRVLLGNFGDSANLGDEREETLNYKILSHGFMALISVFLLYGFSKEILRALRMDYSMVIIPPYTTSAVIEYMYIIGWVCFIITFIIIRKGIFCGNTPLAVCFMGITFPASFLAQIPYYFIHGNEKATSKLTLLLMPLLAVVIYLFMNHIYVKYQVKTEELED